MGEAKRRGRNPTTGAPGEADRLPDFIFLRERAAEEAAAFILAGRLVTDIPKYNVPSESDQRLITDTLEGVMHLARGDPELEAACAWRSSELPPDALSATFPAAAGNERVKCCGVVAMRIDRNGRDELMCIDTKAPAKPS
jgi:hypothetical protein